MPQPPRQPGDNPRSQSRGDWVWTWMRRILGALGFLVILVLLSIEREVPGALIVVVGGLLGAEFLPWASKNGNGNGRRRE